MVKGLEYKNTAASIWLRIILRGKYIFCSDNMRVLAALGPDTYNVGRVAISLCYICSLIEGSPCDKMTFDLTFICV